MTIVGRTIVRSTGYIGAPGINVIHWTAGLGPGPTDEDGVDEFHATLFDALTNYDSASPVAVDFAIEPQVVYFDASDGVLLGSTSDPDTPRVWSGTDASYPTSMANQLCIRFNTGTYVNGRELQGRMFLGPCGGYPFGLDGQVSSSIVNATPTWFSGLISGGGGRLAVWHRPTSVSAADGVYADVTAATCNTTPGTLRSRKT